MPHNDGVWFVTAAVLAYLPIWSSAPYRPHVLPFLLALGPPFLLLFFCHRAARKGRLSVRWLLAVGLVARLGFLAQAPTLSEDVYRYFWDGSLTAHGESPFLEPPEALPQWRAGRPELYSLMAHRDRRTVYPPLAQIAFAFNQTLWPDSLPGWKLLLLLAEAGLVAAFWKGFRLPADRLALWLLHPLVVVEFYSSGHLDILALAAAGAALWFLSTRGRRSAAAGAGLLAAAGLVKIFPVFLFPLALRLRGRGEATRMLAAFGLAVVAISLPLLLWTGSAVDSVRSFADSLLGFHAEWRFNSLPFFLLEGHRRAAGAAASFLFAAIVALTALGGRGPIAAGRAGGTATPKFEDFAARAYFLMAALLALSHTVHPWYTTWILLFAPVLGLRYRAGFWLASVSSLSYLAYGVGSAGLPPWVLWLEYAPYYLLLLRDLSAYHQGGNAWKTISCDDQARG